MSFLLQAMNWGVYYSMRYYEQAIDCGDGGDFTMWVLYQFQSRTNYEILVEWQVWRLLTPGYVHANFDHIYGNMMSIFFTSIILEWQLGPKKLFGLYNFTVFFGNISSGLYQPYSIGMGASTAVYSFYGAIFGAALRQKYGMRTETNMVILLPVAYYSINLLISNFEGSGDTVIHASGWTQGLLFVILLLPDLHFQGGWLNTDYRDLLYFGSFGLLLGGNLLQLILYLTAIQPF